MTALVSFVSLFISFAAAVLTARLLIPVFRKKGLVRTSLTQRDGGLTPGGTSAGMGVIPLAAGFAAAVLTGGILSLVTGTELITVTALRIFGGLLFVLLTALAAGLDDWRSLRGRENVHPIINIALFAVIARFYTALLTAGGDRSDILILPFAGQADIGIFYDIFCFLVLMGSCFGSIARADTGDIAASSAMFTGLSLAAAGGILGSAPAAVLGSALAGCALGGLVYGFPPAKLLCGRGGAALFGAASAAAAMGCGIPALAVPAALPLVFEGIFALIRLGSLAFTGKPVSAGSFCGWLCSLGLSYRGASLVNLIISLAGLVLTVFSALKI